jgi:hypothetical protein
VSQLSLTHRGITGHGISAYTEGAIDRQSDTLTAVEANQIIDILSGEVTL